MTTTHADRRGNRILMALLGLTSLLVAACSVVGPSATTFTNGELSTFASSFDLAAMGTAVAATTGRPKCDVPPVLSGSGWSSQGGSVPIRSQSNRGALIACVFSGTSDQLLAAWSTQVGAHIAGSDVTVRGKGASGVGAGDAITDEWQYEKGTLSGDARLRILENGPGAYCPACGRAQG